jgi:hypothetical protein
MDKVPPSSTCRRRGRASPKGRDRSWSSSPTRGSALIGWVADDAAFLADQIAAMETARDPGVPVPIITG